ncbi:MAG: hypothetical protein J6M65_11375 [Eubacterium sp.]|nr:hypothetical protein [Eubacterium sp.]
MIENKQSKKKIVAKDISLKDRIIILINVVNTIIALVLLNFGNPFSVILTFGVLIYSILYFVLSFIYVIIKYAK